MISRTGSSTYDEDGSWQLDRSVSVVVTGGM